MLSLPGVGDTIDSRYRVERVLGRGGMGVVVAARRLRLGQMVAIKFPLAHLGQRRDVVERLLREASAAMKLRSEHVARVYDVGIHEGNGPYLVMEYMVGRDLARALKEKGPISSDTAIEYVLQACEALSEAHVAGIVHRDLKPSNLFLSSRPDGSPLIKVIDFGLAKSICLEQHVTLTDSGALLGSPPFMAPEQMRGATQIDARADIFSLGATLYALIAGEPPFPGKGVLDVYDRIVAGMPSIRDRRPDVPPELEVALECCLQVVPDRRFASMAELAEALAPLSQPHAKVHAQRARGILAEAARAATSEPAMHDDVATDAATVNTISSTRTPQFTQARESHRDSPATDASRVASASGKGEVRLRWSAHQLRVGLAATLAVALMTALGTAAGVRWGSTRSDSTRLSVKTASKAAIASQPESPVAAPALVASATVPIQSVHRASIDSALEPHEIGRVKRTHPYETHKKPHLAVVESHPSSSATVNRSRAFRSPLSRSVPVSAGSDQAPPSATGIVPDPLADPN